MKAATTTANVILLLITKLSFPTMFLWSGLIFQQIKTLKHIMGKFKTKLIGSKGLNTVVMEAFFEIAIKSYIQGRHIS